LKIGESRPRQSGIENELVKHWMGTSINEKWAAENTVLSGGQMILGFVGLSVVFNTCFALLCVELIMKHIDYKSANNKIPRQFLPRSDHVYVLQYFAGRNNQS
jgi:hypothetical protein